MADFATRFAGLKAELDDPGAAFWGENMGTGAERMRNALLALVPDIPDRVAEARLFRELAVLTAKGGERACLDHADRALAAQDATGALPADQLYFMHWLCGEASAAWDCDPRTDMHLDRALALHAALGRPLVETFFLRQYRGVHERACGRPRLGLDSFEPLLADIDRHHGLVLNDVLRLMAESEERLCHVDRAMAYAERRVRQLDGVKDPNLKVEAMGALARLHARAGRLALAERLLEDAIVVADGSGLPLVRQLARAQKLGIVSG